MTQEITMTDIPISPAPKSQILQTCTIRNPEFSYSHLQLIGDDPSSKPTLDELQVRSYLSAALTRFLGATGNAIAVDILKVQGGQCWLRVPRQDLSAFVAAVTAWRGAVEEGSMFAFRVRGCSDWLGSLVGGDGQDELWG